MMIRFLLPAALPLAAALAPLPVLAQQAQTVLDFEDLSGTGPMPASYRGVNFGNDFFHYDTPHPDFPPASGQTTLYANYARFPSGEGGTYTFRFDQAVRFDGAYFSGRTTVYYEFYRNGQRMGGANPFLLNDEARFYASDYSGLVDEVRFTGNSGNWVMDDLNFTTGIADVPEPASWGMMIAGFALCGVAMRRARRLRRAPHA